MFLRNLFYNIVFIFTFLVNSSSFSETINEECENFDVNYSENEFLTDREQVEAMDDALIESLNRFEECIKAKATARKNTPNDSVEKLSNGLQELRGNKFGENQESIGSYNEQNQSGEQNQNQNLRSELTDSINKKNLGSNGKIPEDIPIDNNDDVLAQQIKNAALNEKDPEKQKKIWNEYRKYKNLPLED